MKDAILFFLMKKPLLFGFSIFVIFIVLTQYLSYQRYLIAKENEQKTVIHEINSVKDRLKIALNHDLAAAKTLAFIIENYGVPNDFDKVARAIVNSNKNIDGIQLTRKGITTNVYPLIGNESVIGFDVLSNPLRSKEAHMALEKKELYFAGPYKLIQGGTAIVGRLPIFIHGDFFGFSVVLVKLPTLLKAAGIDSLNNNHFIYQLSKINPITQQEEFFLPNQNQFDKEQSISIEVPDGAWKLYVMPSHKNNFSDTFIFSLLGIGLSFILALFAWHLARQPQRLNELVEEKTAQLISLQSAINTTLNRINDGMISLDNEWKYTFLNDASLTNHSLGRNETLGKIIWDIHPHMKNTLFWEKYHEAMRTKKVVEFESKYDYADVWLLVKIYPSPDGLTIIYTDISRRKQAEEENIKTTEELRKLTARLQNIREEERTRIAREIHDELGQQLTGLKMDAFWIEKKISSNDEFLQKRVSDMITLIDNTIVSVRRIASELRPSILDDLGLIAALDWQTQDFENRTGIKSNFINHTHNFNPESELSTTIFRVYQEALTNIIRHAKASVVETTIEIIEDCISLTIKDDGCGFDVNDVKFKNSFGLVGMNERILLFNGIFTIESQKLKGTKISLKIPLLKKDKTV